MWHSVQIPDAVDESVLASGWLKSLPPCEGALPWLVAAEELEELAEPEDAEPPFVLPLPFAPCDGLLLVLLPVLAEELLELLAVSFTEANALPFRD